MAEAINQGELEGANSTVNLVDAYDYLAYATAQVRPRKFNLNFFGKDQT